MIEKLATLQANIVRVWPWLLASFVLLAVIYWVRPMQLENVVSKTVNITMGAFLGYWVDRSAFRGFAGTDTMKPGDVLSANRTLARSIIYAACIVGMCLAV